VTVEAVALAHLRHELGAKVGPGVHQATLATAAKSYGLTDPDAALLAASLLSEGERAQTNDADRVRRLLEDGQLNAARAALNALPESADGYHEVAQQVEAAEKHLRTLVTQVHKAADEGREDDAELLLTEAARTASDDESVERLMTQLPPAPPSRITVTAAGDGVEVSWQASRSLREGVRYEVRGATRRGGSPGHARDGRDLDPLQVWCDAVRPPPPGPAPAGGSAGEVRHLRVD
jgi:hypothetical protein